VLNAKQHAKEASIVAQAGRQGAVTIATNMAGRGTDIVLGGNFEAMANHELLKEGIEPDELTLEEKRRKYPKLLEKTREEQKAVIAAGGLHIIGTERHESRRIDNQLRGRSGRQGDPGSSKFFLSLDDDLMRIFGSERIAAIMDRLGAEEGEVISHPLVSRSIGGAQKRVEGRNFEIRKHLKEYDDVMNLQRREIYGLRQRILRGEDLKDEILDQVASYLEDIIMRHTSEGKYPENWALQPLYTELQTTFGITYRIADGELTSKTQKALFDEVWSKARSRYQEKEMRFGSETMRQFERSVFLMVIDNLWKDHLYEMDHLKGGVQYRAFGQKNPLYEYQREGLKMFDELRSSISKEVASYLYRLERVEHTSRSVDTSQTMHGDFDIFASSEQAAKAARPVAQPVGAAAGRSDLVQRTIVKTGVEVGRNDPCPCGSGKKYKKCHGAL
ncbi:MAG: SEC-C domain-containing protein, partial [Chitinispirillaceae bacterium]|nr:SEC-C domain-containing protein [Chitinispirillaceae bacterium]